MKKCELCKSTARMYCESDQANLCWDCDARVHAANFLVAKHLRTLLCDSCQSPTPWTASGPKLGPTVSICQSCVVHRIANRSVDHGRLDDDDEDEDGDEDGNDEEEEEEDDDDDDASSDNDDGSDGGDGDYQVVPLGSKNSPAPPRSSSSSSNSEDSSTKRSTRRNGNSNSRFGIFH